jgi:hypothetical protein
MGCGWVHTSPLNRGFAEVMCCSVRQNPPESGAFARQMPDNLIAGYVNTQVWSGA